MGAPIGNKNAAKAKVWSAAIERALERRIPADERIRAIDELADKLLDLAYAKDLSALQELGNRLEGRPSQALQVSGTLDSRAVPYLSDEELERIASGNGPDKGGE